MDPSEATIYHAVIMASLLIGGLFAVLVAVILRSQRKFVRMQRQLLLDEINILEKERTRIARDLHDDVGPKLTVTDVLLTEARRGEKVNLAFIQRAQQNISEINLQMKEISRNLTPVSLAERGLDAVLQEFILQIDITGKIGIAYSYRVSSTVNPVMALQVYRIVQELVHNGLKHSAGSKMIVQLKERKKRLFILYRDDGVGLTSVKGRMMRRGLGKGSVQSRVEMLGGKLQVLSEKGTSYFIELPINFNADE